MGLLCFVCMSLSRKRNLIQVLSTSDCYSSLFLKRDRKSKKRIFQKILEHIYPSLKITLINDASTILTRELIFETAITNQNVKPLEVLYNEVWVTKITPSLLEFKTHLKQLISKGVDH